MKDLIRDENGDVDKGFYEELHRRYKLMSEECELLKSLDAVIKQQEEGLKRLTESEEADFQKKLAELREGTRTA